MSAARNMSIPAFTLIECLAVVALMALAAGTIAVGLAPTAEQASFRAARGAVLDVDARARVIARKGEPVLLRVEDGRVTAAPERSTTAILERSLPAHVEVVLLEPFSRQPLRAVRIGSDGRSADYLVQLSSGERSAETTIAGLTGYAFEEVKR